MGQYMWKRNLSRTHA